MNTEELYTEFKEATNLKDENVYDYCAYSTHYGYPYSERGLIIWLKKNKAMIIYVSNPPCSSMLKEHIEMEEKNK